jgi:peptidoglycan/LPS O-acetylase OafA/YrhL
VDLRNDVERIDALTGLRILAALAVMLSHMAPPADASPTAIAFLTSGYCGVTVFFVLSGFVLTHNYFDRLRSAPRPRLLWSYLVARIARVYPLYLLLLVWISLPHLLKGEGSSPLWQRHALALQAWAPKAGEAFAYNGPGWSISVEFFLYACFPLLVFLFAPVSRRVSRMLVALGLVATVMGLATWWFVAQGYDSLPMADPRSAHRWLFRNPFCRLGDFALGILTARLVGSLRGSAERSWRGLANAAVALGATAIVALMCWPAHTRSAPSWDFSYALPATLLIFGLALSPLSLAARALSTKPMLLLGESSYALYLVHYRLLGQIQVAAPPGRWLIVEGLTAFMLIAMAIGLNVAFERPVRSMLRSVLDPLSRRRAPRPAEPPSPGPDRETPATPPPVRASEPAGAARM